MWVVKPARFCPHTRASSTTRFAGSATCQPLDNLPMSHVPCKPCTVLSQRKTSKLPHSSGQLFYQEMFETTDRVVNSDFHYTGRQIEVTSSDAFWMKKKSCHQRPALLFRSRRDKSKDMKHLYLHTRTHPGHELLRIHSRAVLPYTRSHGVDHQVERFDNQVESSICFFACR